jgi:hypothetical protein
MNDPATQVANPATLPVLDAALAEWTAGRYYEAHELLEEVLEPLDEADPSYRSTMALVHLAACFHKLSANVAPRAVPAKMAHALEALQDTPADWWGLNLGAFRDQCTTLLAQLGGVEVGGPVPAGLSYPILSRR